MTYHFPESKTKCPISCWAFSLGCSISTIHLGCPHLNLSFQPNLLLLFPWPLTCWYLLIPPGFLNQSIFLSFTTTSCQSLSPSAPALCLLVFLTWITKLCQFPFQYCRADVPYFKLLAVSPISLLTNSKLVNVHKAPACFPGSSAATPPTGALRFFLVICHLPQASCSCLLQAFRHAVLYSIHVTPTKASVLILRITAKDPLRKLPTSSGGKIHLFVS